MTKCIKHNFTLVGEYLEKTPYPCDMTLELTGLADDPNAAEGAEPKEMSPQWYYPRFFDVKGWATIKWWWFRYSSSLEVIEIEYNSYAIIHSCSKVWYGTYCSDNFWILSRTIDGLGKKFLEDKIEQLKIGYGGSYAINSTELIW